MTRYRIATDQALSQGASLVLEGNAAHYLAHVLRLGVGESIVVFSRAEGEWRAEITEIRKKAVSLRVLECLRPPAAALPFTVCFAPIKGGRLETILEKATELGAAVLQPVITRRTIVDKVNLERAEAIAREAAEQCERIDWPEIRAPLKLEKLLAEWPADTMLYYGDETGGGVAITELFRNGACGEAKQTSPFEGREVDALASGGGYLSGSHQGTPTRLAGDLPPEGRGKFSWAILAGPEGGFTPEELALLKRVKSAQAVGLGPRILRADTAIITLCALTLAAFGDWHQPPRFTGE